MTSAVNVRNQLIRVIFVLFSFIIQCDGQSDCGPGKVLEYEYFDTNISNCSITSRTQMIMIMIFIIIRPINIISRTKLNNI